MLALVLSYARFTNTYRSHSIRFCKIPYTNKTLASAEINWSSDLVPGMQIFAASRVAMRKQRMKRHGCRRCDNEGQWWGVHYLHVAHNPVFIHLFRDVLKMGQMREKKSDSRRVVAVNWFMAWWLLGWSSEIPCGAQEDSRSESCRGVEVAQGLCLKSSFPTGAQTLPQAGLLSGGPAGLLPKQAGSCLTPSPPCLSVLSVSSLCASVV